MSPNVPQLLSHARKPVRERTLVRHTAPAGNVCRHEKTRTRIPKPILISVALHLAMAFAIAALYVSASPIIRQEVEKGKGGVAFVLRPASDFSRPAPSRMETKIEAATSPVKIVARPSETIAPAPEALPVLPLKPEPAPVVAFTPAVVPVVTPVAPVTEAKKKAVHITTSSSSASSSSRGAVSSAYPVYNPAPAYPEAAREAGQQGVVNLDLVVSPVGTVEEVKVARTSGYSSLDRAAMEAVRHWKFSNGNSASTFRQPITFNLDQGVDE